MSKQKVRPMVDKELRDEIVGYLGGAGSFNEALRWYVKGYKRLAAKNKAQAEDRRSRLKMDLMFTRMELDANIDHGIMLVTENQALKNQLKRDADELHKLKQEVANLHNKKVNLEKWSSGVEQRNVSLMDEIIELKKANFELSTKLEGTDKAYKALLELYMDKRVNRLTYLRWGIVFGLVTGLAIGYLFL